MRPITGDCACGRFFLQTKMGTLRVYCDECRKARKNERNRTNYVAHPERLAAWYAKNRKNNPEWRALNKKRAKAWRAANRDHIRAYRSEYNEARA